MEETKIAESTTEETATGSQNEVVEQKTEDTGNPVADGQM